MTTVTWKEPLLGRRVEVVYPKLVVDEKPKHWWNAGKHHFEDRVYHTGEVVDRSPVSAEYAVACEDGKVRWVWSDSLRLKAEIAVSAEDLAAFEADADLVKALSTAILATPNTFTFTLRFTRGGNVWVSYEASGGGGTKQNVRLGPAESEALQLLNIALDRFRTPRT